MVSLTSSIFALGALTKKRNKQMQFNLNRREFVGGAAALAAAGCCCAKPSPRYGGTGKIRLAVAGVMGKGFSDWMPMVKSGLAEVVAFFDADANTVKSAANNIANEKKKGKLSSQFEHRIVDFVSHGDTHTFINSSVTGRWWMEVPVVKKNTTELVPCSVSDYRAATESQVPIRWLFYYNKFNTL